MTPGANIDIILCEFLKEHSKKFRNFSVLETSSDKPTAASLTHIDYRVLCETVDGNSKALDAKFYVSDIHNKQEKLEGIVHRTQTYKMLQDLLSL